MSDYSSSFYNSTRRPQQEGLSSHSRSILQDSPPTASETPFFTPHSKHVRRSYHQPQPSKLHYGSPFGSPPLRSVGRIQRQNSKDYQRNYGSPFMSPPPVTHQKRSTRPKPLVLDPQKSVSVAPSPDRSVSSMNSSNSVPVVHQIFQAATHGIREHTSPALVNRQNSKNLHATPAVDQTEQAAVLARSATQAGYLLKLGANIQEYKRRFFVLKPETRLYYFLSPNDMEPRGKFDLEGCKIEEINHLPDGRFRFAIHSNNPQQKRIVLEARTKEIGLEWIKHMENERVSTLKNTVDQLKSEKIAQQTQIHDLEKDIENFRLIEKDRDGALEDARKWKEKFEQLDEAIRLLTQKVRQPPAIERTNATKEEEKKEEDSKDIDETPIKSNSKRDSSESDIPDSKQKEEEDKEEGNDSEKLEYLDVPGTYFSSLFNACEQQRELLRLTSIEAAVAVEDVHAANEKVTTIEKRMEKAEKHLTKLWEENCTIRKSLKQKKQEKRVLVREFKSLQQSVKEMEETRQSSTVPPKEEIDEQEEVEDEEAVETDTIGSEEERLIVELEEHVASSIRLHERLIAGSDFNQDETNTTVQGSEILFHRSPDKAGESEHDMMESSSTNEQGRLSSEVPVTSQPQLVSLLDESDSEEESNDDGDVLNEYESLETSIVSSVGATMGDHFQLTDSLISEGVFRPLPSPKGSPDRLHPIAQLDIEEEDDDQVSESGDDKSNFMITENGHATSRLVCPLADVVETKNTFDQASEAKEEHSIYHITFYSKKIGIQFQKGPPPPSKPRGLLNDAVTVDLGDAKDGSEKTAAELSNIASFHSFAKGSNNTKDEEDVCVVASPKDIVLVCGFEGFDDSGANKRPNLGARLVAFDGISVEIGAWTFDSIRKAIKARGRPLTLSFRNDFLTTEQRAILTKAVMDVDAKSAPSVPKGIYTQHLSRTSSMNSAVSHEYDVFVNGSPHEELNASDLFQEQNCCHRGMSSASSSFASRIRRNSSTSVSTQQTSLSTQQLSVRSYSEAGSSTISSAFAPLVANLMKGVSARKREKENFTPVYLYREPKSLEGTPQHQDFRSNLL